MQATERARARARRRKIRGNMSPAVKVNVRVDSARADALLSRIARRAARPARALRFIVGYAAEAVRGNFAMLDKQRSRYGHAFYIREGERKTKLRMSGSETAEIVVASRQMAHKLRGGTVRPVNRKFLTIPNSAWAKSQDRPAGVIGGLEVFLLRNGRAYLARAKADGTRAFGVDYWLVKSVTHRPRPETIPSVEVLRAACERGATAFVRAEFSGFGAEGGAAA